MFLKRLPSNYTPLNTDLKDNSVVYIENYWYKKRFMVIRKLMCVLGFHKWDKVALRNGHHMCCNCDFWLEK